MIIQKILAFYFKPVFASPGNEGHLNMCLEFHLVSFCYLASKNISSVNLNRDKRRVFDKKKCVRYCLNVLSNS